MCKFTNHCDIGFFKCDLNHNQVQQLGRMSGYTLCCIFGALWKSKLPLVGLSLLRNSMPQKLNQLAFIMIWRWKLLKNSIPAKVVFFSLMPHYRYLSVLPSIQYSKNCGILLCSQCFCCFSHANRWYNFHGLFSFFCFLYHITGMSRSWRAQSNYLCGLTCWPRMCQNLLHKLLGRRTNVWA